MGTDVTVIVVGADTPNADHGAEAALAERALARIGQLEARWSRFRPDSEVSRLNGAVGATVEVSTDTALLLARAVEAWELSAGLVDCTQLTEVMAAGYDRSFDQLPADRNRATLLRRHYGGDPGDIVLDGTTVRLSLGLGFDPGGIGKGLAADIVSAEIMVAGAAGVCVNLGGDLRVRGTGPTSDGWTISIDHPRQARPLVLLGLGDGAVASSTTLRRQWLVDGEPRHHLIDPRTGQPSRSDVVFATAVADEGWRAETMAKAVLLRGGSHPFDLLGGTGVEALAVDADGAMSCSPGFTRFTAGIEPAPHLSLLEETRS